MTEFFKKEVTALTTFESAVSELRDCFEAYATVIVLSEKYSEQDYQKYLNEFLAAMEALRISAPAASKQQVEDFIKLLDSTISKSTRPDTEQQNSIRRAIKNLNPKTE